jgi:hypothetical protein
MPKRLQLEFPEGTPGQRIDLLGTKERPDDVTMRDALVELGQCIDKVYGDSEVLRGQGPVTVHLADCEPGRLP